MYIILVGLLSHSCQLLTILSLQRVESGIYALFMKCLSIILGFTVDIFYFGTIPDEISTFGIILILGTVFGSLIFHKENKNSNNNNKQGNDCINEYLLCSTDCFSSYKRIK